MVLTSPLALGAWATCTGSYIITPADVDNLEKRSEATVTAVDKYDTVVQDEASVNVGLDQVSTGGFRMALVPSLVDGSEELATTSRDTRVLDVLCVGCV